MKEHKRFPVIAVGLVLAFGSFARSESVGDLLEKGIYTEQTVGDLDAAIKIYGEIVAQAEANRSCIAQAYYRLGMCYLKQTKATEAQDAFRRLMADFPEQTALVAEASKHVAVAEFPQILGCRLKEAVSLVVRPPTPGIKPDPPKTIFEGSLLEIRWSVDSKLDRTVRRFALPFNVALRPAELAGQEAGKNTWELKDVPAETRSVEYGKSLGEGVSSREVSPLRPGTYLITVTVSRGRQELLGTGTATLVVKPPPYTQIMVNDIQPDGVINFQSVGQTVNPSAVTTTKHFCNSDIVHLTRMWDDKGRPLKFTSQHEGRNYQYDVTFNEPIPAGQPILDRSEGTVTDLIKPVSGAKDEYEYSMTHWPGVRSDTRRIEIFRLPKGAELVQTTPTSMARRIQNGRTELFVEKMIPPGSSITTAVRYRLPGAQLAAEKPLTLSPAPWADGEVMQLAVRTAAGLECGTVIYTAETTKSAGADVWRLQSHTVIPIANMLQYTIVDVERESFAPVTGRTKNSMGDCRAVYESKKVHLTTIVAGKKSSREIARDRVAYDNEEALYLIRRLPLAKGYEASFPIFAVQGGIVLTCRISVTDTEKLTVPAGSYDCHKVTLEIYAGGARTLQHQLWFSADKHRYLVKYDAVQALMDLVKVETRDQRAPFVFCDEASGVSIALPAGWWYYRHTAPTGAAFTLQLLPPGPEVWSVLAFAQRSPGATTVRKAAEENIGNRDAFLKGYSVRQDSWTDREISGLPTSSYAADYQNEGRSMVEYRTYLLGKSRVYWLVFRVEKSEFDASKTMFDSVAAGFKVNE